MSQAGKGVFYCTLLQHVGYFISPFLDTIQKKKDTDIVGSMFQFIELFLELAGICSLHAWKC